jgi:hypothetical protein
VYGLESNTGLGGVAAQAPGGDVYLGRVLGIQPRAGALVSQGAGRNGLAYFNPAVAMIGNPSIPAAVSASGGSVERPAWQMLTGNWRNLLDFHSSPLPWLVLATLVLYGWLHVSVRAGKRARFSLG